MRVFTDEWRFDDGLIRIWYDTHNAESEHKHDFLEIVLVIEGSVIHRVDNDIYKLEKGGVVFINPGQIHSFFSIEKMKFVNISISRDFLNQKFNGTDDFFQYAKSMGLYGDISNVKQYICLDSKDNDHVEHIISVMCDEYENKGYNYTKIISGLLDVLIMFLVRKIITQQLNPATIDLKEYIDSRSFDNISIKEIADSLGYNVTYLCSKFKTQYNKTILNHIKENRAKAAEIMLENTDYSIERIAAVIGYKDVKQIYKLLKSFYGLTPNKIRKRAQETGGDKNDCQQ